MFFRIFNHFSHFKFVAKFLELINWTYLYFSRSLMCVHPGKIKLLAKLLPPIGDNNLGRDDVGKARK